MGARDRIQDMLCEKVENLESVIRTCAKKVDALHSSVNVMENSRQDKEVCGITADGLRDSLREIVKRMEAAL